MKNNIYKHSSRSLTANTSTEAFLKSIRKVKEVRQHQPTVAKLGFLFEFKKTNLEVHVHKTTTNVSSYTGVKQGLERTFPLNLFSALFFAKLM